MADKDLFTFEWPVDKAGYDLELVKPRRSPGRSPTQLTAGHTEPYYVIRRQGGPLSYYRPLEDHPGLARRLADLATTAPSDDTALRDFANECGLLGLWSFGVDPEEQRQEEVADWRSRARSLRHVFWLKDAGKLQAACELFNEHIHPRFTARIHYQPAAADRRLQIAPLTLIGALWLQVAGELTHGTRFKKCRQCPTWFPVGRGAMYRSSREFCSNRCRMAWHRHHKEKAK